MAETFSEWVRRHAVDSSDEVGSNLLVVMAEAHERDPDYTMGPMVEVSLECAAEDIRLTCGRGDVHIAYAIGYAACVLLHAVFEEAGVKATKSECEQCGTTLVCPDCTDDW